eukprot:CAMPEP_0175333710 /NCGR_PEP_ID=MMETSP0095-20121207/2420_2 /TAXON_ID=311494 /ORGANISM="Alexandrium monilatum, Strain CCMP3105" /LENGTH=296 /DNA_ID=CAMNT_0016631011 /DNA_START=321 /DNA_END=1214 /DNA_ORIENTATION=-
MYVLNWSSSSVDSTPVATASAWTPLDPAMADLKSSSSVHSGCTLGGVEVPKEYADVVWRWVRPGVEEVYDSVRLVEALLGQFLNEELVLETPAGQVRAHHIHCSAWAVLPLELQPHHGTNRELSLRTTTTASQAEVAGDLHGALVHHGPARISPDIDLVAEQIGVDFLLAAKQRRRVPVDHVVDRLCQPQLPGAHPQVETHGAQGVAAGEALLHADDVRGPRATCGLMKALSRSVLVLGVARKVLEVEGHNHELISSLADPVAWNGTRHMAVCRTLSRCFEKSASMPEDLEWRLAS